MTRKYLFFIIVFSFVLNAFAEDLQETDIITGQTETMLNEIRSRNGIENSSSGEESYENVEAVVLENEEKSVEKTDDSIIDSSIVDLPPPKKSFLKDGRQGFALGIDINVGASNSYFTFTDFLKETLEIDLNNMSKILPNAGYSLSAASNINLYLDIYIKSKAEFGFFTRVLDGNAFINIPKDIIDFAAKGNSGGTGLVGSLTGYGRLFTDTGIFYGMQFGGFKFRVSASYFIPLLYTESAVGSYELVNDPVTGKVVANGDLKLTLYSHIPVFGRPINQSGIDIKDILSTGGVDFSFYGSYKFNELANLNLHIINIPIYPSRLNKGLSKTFKGKFEMESILQYMDKILPNKSGGIKPPRSSFDEKDIAYDLPQKNIFRSLKLNISSDIRPFFNDYLIITPSLGFHCYQPFYIDGGLRLESRFLKVLGAYIGMSREDRVWKNTAGLFLETRIFRLETAVSSASPSFIGSFRGTGAEATIKLVLGY